MLLNNSALPGAAPKRIISLVPSQTELLHYLGLHEEIAGITKFCIRPAEWFRNKTKIGGTKNVNIKKIKALAPDLIIANKEENIQEQIEELANDFPVWVTDVTDLKSAYDMIKDIGALTHKDAEAKKLITDIKKEFARLSNKTDEIKTAYIIWRHPYMAAGADTFINSIMEEARLLNIFNLKKRYPKITIEELQQSGCKLVILSTEPYPFKEKHIAELEKELTGIKIILADGEMFSWYGSHMLYIPQYLLNLLNNIKSS
jgi:ABC-type Fe3+-hydroxamate transport system substrate-binding protein